MNAMEGETMKKLESKWLGKQRSNKCLDLNAQVSSSLSPESFWGLFLIAGISSLSALLIHVAIFFYGQRHIILRCPASTEATTYDRILLVFKIFGQKYSKSPHGTSEKSTEVLSTDRRGGTDNVNVHGIVPIDEAIANSSSPRQSPSSGTYSEHRDPSLDFSEEQDQISTGCEDLNRGPVVELTIQN
ncbi:hypothetical protein PanWU01x14_182360 [Parasponia andersonii]|uniref:Transmembrane protein n=1 Tax=Parasponia andersonii TaxID=3476 RepID=A0A2P5C5F6_PARAD|nr:hypothetical protein PanWU01x14_182360 [Parasponia andersonii]